MTDEKLQEMCEKVWIELENYRKWARINKNTAGARDDELIGSFLCLQAARLRIWIEEQDLEISKLRRLIN